MCGFTVSGRRSRRKCCSDMKLKYSVVFLLVLSVAPLGQTVPGQTAPSKPENGKTARDKPSSDKLILESALVTVIEEVEIPSKVEGVLAAVEAREGRMVEAGTVL